MEATELLVNGLLLVAGGFLGKGYEWILAKSKSRIEEGKADTQNKATEFDKTTALQREMIVDLREDIEEMVGLLKQLENERLDCRVELAGTKAENKALRAELEAAKAELDHLERELDKKS